MRRAAEAVPPSGTLLAHGFLARSRRLLVSHRQSGLLVSHRQSERPSREKLTSERTTLTLMAAAAAAAVARRVGLGARTAARRPSAAARRPTRPQRSACCLQQYRLKDTRVRRATMQLAYLHHARRGLDTLEGQTRVSWIPSCLTRLKVRSSHSASVGSNALLRRESKPLALKRKPGLVGLAHAPYNNVQDRTRHGITNSMVPRAAK